ncbi:MAG: polyprenyl synthetase family protein [Desulfatibacillaceae bacterium]
MSSIKQEILEAARDDLAAIEQALTDNLNPRLDLVREIAGHVLFAGGKRLRPLLMVLSARLCGYPGGFDHTLSTVFEYLHTATLLHDDVVDESDRRRGRAAGHIRYGIPMAVLTGDFLLARTCSIATDTGRLPVIKTIADVTGVMSEGEIQQISNTGRPELTEEEYDEVIYRKTAVLMEAACKVGALLADAGDSEVTALAEYGRLLGMAFQVVDDLLDYDSDPDVTGKAVGTDIREGKVTLPLIHALRSAPPDDARRLRNIVRARRATDEEFAFVRDMIHQHGGADYSKQRAADMLERAKSLLKGFPEGPTRAQLARIADFVREREQ